MLGLVRNKGSRPGDANNVTRPPDSCVAEPVDSESAPAAVVALRRLLPLTGALLGLRRCSARTKAAVSGDTSCTPDGNGSRGLQQHVGHDPR